MSTEYCGPCRDVIKFFADPDDAASNRIFDRSEAIKVVRYILKCNDSKSCCRCMIRNLTVFWTALGHFQKIFKLMARLTDKLNEDCVLFDEMQNMVATSSNEGLESDDEELQIDGFTLTDRSDIARSCALLLSDNFSLYIAYQRHYGHIIIPVQFSEPTSRVRKHFFVGNLPSPVCFMLNALLESNLLQRIVSCMSKPKIKIRPEIVGNLSLVFLTVKQYSNDSTSRRYFWPIRESISNFICGLADNNDNQILRNLSVRQLSEQIWSMGREFVSSNKMIDVAGLNLSLKHLSSHFLAARMAGLHQICVIINHWEEHEPEDSTDFLGNFLSSHQVVQLIFGPNLHAELIKQSHIFLAFMAMQGVLSKTDLDSIWAAATMKHCNRQVLDLLIAIVKCLESELIVHLYSLLKTIKPSEHNDLTLQLTFYVIKSIWSLWLVQTFRKSHRNRLKFDQTLRGSLEDNLGVIDAKSPRTASVSTDTSSIDSTNAGADSNLNDVIVTVNVDEEVSSSNDLPSSDEKSIEAKSIEIDRKSNEKSISCHMEGIVKNLDKTAELLQRKLPIDAKSFDVENSSHKKSIDEKSIDKELSTDEKSTDNQSASSGDKTGLMQSRVKRRAPTMTSSTVTSSSSSSGTVAMPTSPRGVGVKRARNNDGDTSTPTTTARSVDGGNDATADKLLRSWLLNDPANTPPTDGARVAGVLVESDGEEDGADGDGILGDEDDEGNETSSSCDVVLTPNELFFAQQRHYAQQLNILENNAILETLVKNKESIGRNKNRATGTDSNVSSDVATSSGRMGDFDDEEDLVDDEDSQVIDDEEVVQGYFDEEQLDQSMCSDGSVNKIFSQQKFGRISSMPKIKFVSSSVHSNLKGHWSVFGDKTRPISLPICKPGHTLLWDLLQDGTYEEKLSVENEQLCLQYIQDLFLNQPCISRQFIEACVENLKMHRSAFISANLLIRLFNSFRQLNPNDQASLVNFWSDLKCDLVVDLIQDLRVCCPNLANSRYGEEAEIKMRLNFLDLIFVNRNFFNRSSMVVIGCFYFAPLLSATMRYLSYENLSILWESLDNCDSHRELLYSWILDQLTNQQRCVINNEVIGLMLANKANRFNSRDLSAVGLLLLQALLKNNPSHACSTILPLMWQVALKNVNTNVAMTAMQLISNYYAYDSASKEIEFVECCMQNLKDACFLSRQTNSLIVESNLTIIHRALNLLYSHVEVSRKKYSFPTRLLELEENWLATPHFKRLQRVQGQQSEPALNVNLSFALHGANEILSSTLLPVSTLVAELKAEVLYKKFRAKLGDQISIDQMVENFLKLKADSKIYLADRELEDHLDFSTLIKMDVKENSHVLIQLPPNHKLSKTDQSATEQHSAVPKLLNHEHWCILMDVIENLDAMALTVDKDLSFRCKSYAARAWQVVQSLPSSVEYENGLFDLLTVSEGNVPQKLGSKWDDFLNKSKRNLFLYALQMIEINLPKCKQDFLRVDGLKWLLNVLLVDTQRVIRNEAFDLWSIETMASMLRILYACLIVPKSLTGHNTPNVEITPPLQNILAGVQKISGKRIKEKMRFSGVHRSTKKKKFVADSHFDATPIDMSLINHVPIDDLMNFLVVLIRDVSIERISGLYNNSYSKLNGIDCCFKLLFSLFYSSDTAEAVFLKMQNFSEFLSDTLLDCTDSLVRREIANNLHKLCQKDSQSKMVSKKIIADLLVILDKAEKITPSSPPEIDNKEKSADSKDYGTSSAKNYFWLLVTSIDCLQDAASIEQQSYSDLEACQSKIFEFIRTRPPCENRNAKMVDHSLVGLLLLATSIVKVGNCRKNAPIETMLADVFNVVFSPPTKKSPNLPKCKTQTSRLAAFDLLVEIAKNSESNFLQLHNLLMRQNSKESHICYPWDYWPKDERRSGCGFVGITNLGATCYMASALQHLFMVPQFRHSILNVEAGQVREHQSALKELQKLFTFLQLSERKAYNPKSFCKNYSMNRQPLNVTDQKDMNEFFTDLITKIDEMSPDLHKLVQSLFGGIMSSNVLSLDCPHVSETTEIFFSIRCPVADMKNLYDSLNSMTLADMLEGDNMYTCSQCNIKVKAEKRVCFKQLPRFLCFNTLRYTFNVVTMTKEKVNTHFSFPMRLDMSAYMEENLLAKHKKDEILFEKYSDSTQYELIGVTVHTGTADGGHYYSFIRDKSTEGLETWHSFNDAEVKAWDPVNIDSECFGGELTKSQFDSISERFMDLPFEKTNSAYMLFYERVTESRTTWGQQKNACDQLIQSGKIPTEFEQMICEDNTKFVQDTMFFDHNYFELISQICWHVAGSCVNADSGESTLLSSKLGLSFLLETLIHSKEKPTLTSWTEFVIKHLSASPAACVWFLAHACQNWLLEILIQCPQRVVREMFQKLCMHAILQLQLLHEPVYLLPWQPGLSVNAFEPQTIGRDCPVTQFIHRLSNLLLQPEVLDSRQLNEYFALIIEFGQSSKMAAKFLLLSSVISKIVNFYSAKCTQETLDANSEDESDEDNNLLILVKSACGLRTLLWSPTVLEKIVKIFALLLQAVLEDRGGNNFCVRANDWAALAGPKGFQFLMQVINDCQHSTDLCGKLISLICHLEPELTPRLFHAMFERLQSSKDEVSERACDGYFTVISLIMKQASEGGSLADMEHDVTASVIEKIWQLSNNKPLIALRWFEKNLSAYEEVQDSLKFHLLDWTDAFLLKNANCTVRHCAAELLIACMQSPAIRQATDKMRQIYEFLLGRLPNAGIFADAENNTQRLVSYFNVLKACLISKDEKLMVIPYFNDLWRLYRTYMCEKQVKINANKQSLLTFWYMASLDCPELVQFAVQHTEISHHFMYTYIFNHNDEEQIEHNKKMLHAFYGLIRLFCQHSAQFAESVAAHENFDFACRSISTSDNLANARNEIFSVIEICMGHLKDQKDAGEKFRAKICTVYLPIFSTSKSHYFTCLRFLRLFETNEDRQYLLQHQILTILSNNLFGIHEMHHNATGCCCVSELTEILRKLLEFLKIVETMKESYDEKNELLAGTFVQEWSNMRVITIKLLELLNSYNPPEMRKFSLECLKKIVSFCDADCLKKIVLIVLNAHKNAKTGPGSDKMHEKIGPYFPRRSSALGLFSQQNMRKVHPPRPSISMCLNSTLIESIKGVDLLYDQSLNDFFSPYQMFVDRLLRVACNLGPDNANAPVLAESSCLLGLEGLPLHSAFFAKFWLDLWQKFKEGKDVKALLDALKECKYLREYLEKILTQEQHSLAVVHLYNFVKNVVEEIAPTCLSNVVKLNALKIAASVLNDFTNVPISSKSDVDKLAYFLARRTAALRVLLLFRQSPAPIISKENLDQLESQLEALLVEQAPPHCSTSHDSGAAADADDAPLETYKRHVLHKYVPLMVDLTRELKGDRPIGDAEGAQSLDVVGVTKM